MIIRILFSVITFLFFNIQVIAQTALINSGLLSVETGTQLIIAGENTGDYINNSGNIELNGKICLSGEWINNAANTVFQNVDSNGEVIFFGTSAQNIKGTGLFTNFENLTVNSGSTVNILAGNAVTVSGTLKVDGDLILKTPQNSSPSGSVITENAVLGSGNIKIERFFTVNGQYQYVSSPIDNATSGLFTRNTPSGNYNPNFYKYNEGYDSETNPVSTTYDDWSNADYGFPLAWEKAHDGDLGSDETLNVAQGYATYNEGDITANFISSIGHLNSGDLNATIFLTENDGNSNCFDGWNLIGNPYPSALDWNSLDWDKTNVESYIAYWDGASENYKIYGSGYSDPMEYDAYHINGGSNIIPAMQGFFVKSKTAGTSNLTIPNTARTHSSQAMLKNADNTSIEYLKLNIENNGFTDETIVKFSELSSDDLEETDFHKMFSTGSNVPQIYSIVENKYALAINSQSVNDFETLIVPLGVVAKSSGMYNFNVIKSSFKDKEVSLVDTYNNSVISTNLSENSVYSCYINEGENLSRFYLLFSQNQALEINDEDAIDVFANGKTITIVSKSQPDTNAEAVIYTVLGQKINQIELNSELEKIYLQKASGIYIVKVRIFGTVYSEKVYIN